MKTTRANAFTLIEIMIVVAIIGLLAAIAVPGFRDAIERARQQACASNRKNIDGAKLRWALDHKAATDVVPPESELFGDNRYLDHKPDCPSRGDYSINAVGEKCACSYTPHHN